MKPVYFKRPADFREWLEQHHATARELWVGFHKRSTGRVSVTWPESVDEALCFGWIDGQLKPIDADRYAVRFTPRRPKSIWSIKNVRRVQSLIRARRMRPEGLAAYRARSEERTAVYSHERGTVKLGPGMEARLKANARAWTVFQAQPPSYRKACIAWVMSARQEATRERRLGQLIECSAAGKPVPPLAFGGRTLARPAAPPAAKRAPREAPPEAPGEAPRVDGRSRRRGLSSPPHGRRP
jgi:uncharacterized protein YdeI (YjbR/CyaY-like superfamily)